MNDNNFNSIRIEAIRIQKWITEKGIQKTHITDSYAEPSVFEVIRNSNGQWKQNEKWKTLEIAAHKNGKRKSKILSQFLDEATTTHPKIDSNDFFDKFESVPLSQYTDANSRIKTSNNDRIDFQT